MGVPRPGAALLALVLAATIGSCRRSAPERTTREVVVYCSLDEPYAKPVIRAYERRTGSRVTPLFDTEASKSIGLAQRIRQEAGRPRADVFWSSEAVRLIQLKQAGLLEPYVSPAAADIPPEYRDPAGTWTGFAARARVIVYNTRRALHPPASMLDLTKPEWRGEVALCNPRIGTAATEAAALFATLGEDRARRYYRDLVRQGARIVDGNSVAAEWTARGETMVGLTDTDDAYTRRDQGLPLGVVFPDQEGAGTLLIPNTAGLIRGAPHPEEGKRFLDYLLSAEAELELARLPSRQIPLHRSARASAPPEASRLVNLKAMKVNYEDLARRMPEVDRSLRETLQR
jgi:iron(III) transport system substrate-binding protein